jgi:surfactin synthase thioesterase subunit
LRQHLVPQFDLVNEAAPMSRHFPRQIRTDCLLAAAARAPQGRWLRGSLHRLSDDRFLKKLHARYGAVPKQMMEDNELRQLQLPMLRADIQMFETYE